MRFSISKFVLSDAIKKVSKAISSKPLVPIFSGIHVKATIEGLTLTGSGDFTIRTFIPHEKVDGAEIYNEGSIVLPAKEFLGIARSMPENEVLIELDEDKMKTVISSGKAKFTLNCMDSNEYPRLKDIKEEGFTIKAEKLKTLMEKTSFAVSKNDVRPILTGVNVFFKNDCIGMVATDSFRLSKVVGEAIEEFEEEGNITIPGKVLKEIPKLIGDSKDVLIKKDDHQIIFKTDDLEIRSKLLEGIYPETDNLIPKDYKTYLEVKRKNLLSALERAVILDDSQITLKINKNNGIFDTIELSHHNNELGQSKENVIIEKVEGEEITLIFNPNYMIDALKQIDEDEIVIKINGEFRPFVVSPKNRNDFVQLIVPIRKF